MAIDLVTQFSPYVDEQFKNESKLSLLTKPGLFLDRRAHNQGL